MINILHTVGSEMPKRYARSFSIMEHLSLHKIRKNSFNGVKVLGAPLVSVARHSADFSVLVLLYCKLASSPGPLSISQLLGDRSPSFWEIEREPGDEATVSGVQHHQETESKLLISRS